MNHPKKSCTCVYLSIFLYVAIVASYVGPSVNAFMPTKVSQVYTKISEFTHGSQIYSYVDQECCENAIDLQDLDRRLEVLERILPSSLMGFYDPSQKSFAVRPGSERFSVTSTLFSLNCLEHDVFSNMVDMDLKNKHKSLSDHGSQGDEKISIRQVLDATLDSDWKEEDLFQVPLMIHVIFSLDRERTLMNGMNEERAKRIKSLLDALLKARPKRRNGQNQPLSDYLMFLSAQAMKTLITEVDGDLKSDVEVGISNIPIELLPPDASLQLSLGLHRCAEISFNELCRQLAYTSCGDGNNFDCMRLAYSLLTYVTSTNALAGTAGLESSVEEGLVETVKPINVSLVKQALRCFFDEQNDEGLWEKGQPIYRSFRRQRNVGNAFVFGADTISSLLKILPSDYFRPHIGALEKTLKWAENNQLEELIPNYCDPVSLKCYGKVLHGWNSPHLTPNTSPQAWSTAQAAAAVLQMRKVIKELMHDDVLMEFRGIKNRGKSNNAFVRLLDTDISDETVNGCTTLKCILENRVLEPFANGIASPSVGASYSCILFGPPGTAKTTVTEAVAESLGWDFLVIDTAVFLADGLTNVAGRIRYVFDRLMQLEETIILFDEIEEFCLDRETPNLGMESRMLTTAMLTAINDLRKKRRSIFFLATNRLTAFDAAIIRPGRFDMQLFVGTPNLNAKCIMLEEKLKSAGIETNEIADIVTTYRTVLYENWETSAMYMNYLEGMQLASLCVESYVKDGEIKNETIGGLLEKQAKVCTVRGPARDEYNESMTLSRY